VGGAEPQYLAIDPSASPRIDVAEHILFLTGRLAERRLTQVLEAMAPSEFTWEIRQIGVKVAALMTPEIIRRRLNETGHASRVFLPGRCRADLAALGADFGVPFERGPDDLKDLPEFFGGKAGRVDLSRYDVRIFAEIAEAPTLDVGYVVSADSGETDELRRGALAGAAYVLSLTEKTLWLAEEVAATPVLIPARHGDLESLVRACETLAARGRAFMADPILDPIHMGFSDSIVRYHALRQRLPEVEILMGIGNLTELSDADTTGITTTLMGLASELHIRNVLVVQVSPHCRRAVRETDVARRMLFAAREDGSLPQGYDPSLLCLRDRKPFPNSPEEVLENAAPVSDRNFRIEIAEDGIHIYNRDGHHLAGDPFELFPKLGVEQDGSHAFYLGVELARAQIAWQLGKRYAQDNELRWGCAVDRPDDDATRFTSAGTTLPARHKPKDKA
jgi:hypothetical protein